MNQIYDDYALVYDQTGQIQFSILTANYLPDLLRAHPVEGRRLLDLACGTGTFAVMQAEAGWQVTGLDQSKTMLAVARRKSLMASMRVAWLQGDLRTFRLEEPVNLVTCWYDSINYLLDPNDVAASFRAAFDALTPGGLFCFDCATAYFLRHYWCGVEVLEGERYLQVMQSAYEDDRSTLILTGFAERSPGHWRRFREVHIERGYTRDFWATTLEAVGFTIEGCYDCFTLQAPNDRSLRLCWVARKPLTP